MLRIPFGNVRGEFFTQKSTAMTKTNVRLTAKDYRNQHKDLGDKLKALEARISKRLYDLCVENPQVPIGSVPDLEHTVIKAKTIVNSMYGGNDYINSLPVETQLKYIETIEKYLADQHPHQQLNMFSTDVKIVPAAPVGERTVIIGGITYSRTTIEDLICNCDKRDMPTYMDEGKRWCPQCGYEVK